MAENPFVAVFVSPVIVKNLLSYLGRSDSKELKLFIDDGSFSKFVKFSMKVSYLSLYNKDESNYKLVRDFFCLYSSRLDSCSYVRNISIHPCSDLVGASSAFNYETLDCSRLKRGGGVGYVVFIPVPLQDEYSFGGDRDPITIIESYVWAVACLDPDYGSDGYSFSDAVIFSKSNLRIIIALNYKNDIFNTGARTHVLGLKVARYSYRLNNCLNSLGIGAVVLPVLWGVYDIEFGVLGVDYSDIIRQYLSLVGFSKKHVEMPFPFASVRTYMLDSYCCKTMVKELKQLNAGAYYVTGDADLVSLFSPGYKDSVFKHISKKILANNYSLLRLGGGVMYDNGEIYYHIKSLGLAGARVASSVLLTQLFHVVDFVARYLLSGFDQSLAYFSEINTCINVDVFAPDNLYCASPPTQKMKNDNAVIINDGGDFMSHITRILRSKKGKGKQLFLFGKKFSKVTSSRHEIVVITAAASDESSSVSSSSQFSSIQVVSDSCLTPFKIKGVFSRLKNMQLTPSQMNSRFSNAGMSDLPSLFHESLLEVSVRYAPFLIYFLTRKGVPKNVNESEKCQERINAALILVEETITGYITTEKHSFKAIEKKIMAFAKNPNKYLRESLRCLMQSAEEKRLEKLGFKFNVQKFVSLCARLESLLRWFWMSLYEVALVDDEFSCSVNIDSVTINAKIAESLAKSLPQKSLSACAQDHSVSSLALEIDLLQLK
ncbi:MAG: hypothetical protein HON55_04935 [Legionellales bacterium]|jgi:hypothetical protein|nr:hypothetical protein [Legionellales bacterium]